MASDVTYGTRGREEMGENEWRWLEAMDLTWELQAMRAGEDVATTRVRSSGTHQGEILGLEPTGESFDVIALTLSSIEDGKIVKWWSEWDFAGLLNQIRAIDSQVCND